ncbi:thiamine pyrophosphate-dependent enzyme [Deferribacter abyssi]|uniref:thiamine pyrophosphate-dependent enzyme n=1 Tax=Deferribacter abyssi TaxID=213806 RepID=UPI003C1E29E5
MKFLMGNELIAIGAYHSGVVSAYAYPGTPSSEILEAYSHYANGCYAQWSINEKIALELAAAEAISGKFVMCSMKQVGLNVAADPLFSVAYTGVKGALIIVSADDPGPYSSQTEQDSRMYAFSAKIPVLDPINPFDAYELTKKGVELSHKFEIPVMIRPVMRVCHSRQSFDILIEKKEYNYGNFKKDVSRWAATPKYRKLLHERLNEKLDKISTSYYCDYKIDRKNKFAIVGSGYSFAIVKDIVKEKQLDIDLYKFDMPFPLPVALLDEIINTYDKILVVEETQPLIEIQFARKDKIFGRLNGFITRMGELTYDYLTEKIFNFINKELKLSKKQNFKTSGIKPRLCSGCGHRPAFYAIKKVTKDKGIFPGDIGCYTLGVNLGAVDTCICMGASVTFAEGLSRSNPEKIVISTIGDSTFFHTGIPALINAVINEAKFVLCILDNETTAMTGFQPVPHESGKVKIEKIVEGIGIDFCKVVDPYQLEEGVKVLEEAVGFVENNKKPAVVIYRHPCVTKIKYRENADVIITDDCKNCRICYEKFECPAIFENKLKNKAEIDRLICVNCGVCISVCPFNAIVRNR